MSNIDKIDSSEVHTVEKLKQIPLGKQGMFSSEQGLGCMSFGIIAPTGLDLQGSKATTASDVDILLSRSSAVGVTHLDTAQAYKNVWGILFGRCCCLFDSSELRMCNGIACANPKFQVATKVPSPYDFNLIKSRCLQSCTDLGVDCIDLQYLHRIDANEPIEVSMEAMKELIAEGKIKYVGLSEASPATIKRAHAVCPITCVQVEWNLLARDIEAEIVPLCAELGIGIVAYSPTARGLLANTELQRDKLGSLDFRKMGNVGQVQKDGIQGVIDAFKAIADKKNVMPAVLCLAWVHKMGRDLLNGAGCVPIPGTGNPKHMEQNVTAVKLSQELTENDMTEIEKAVPYEFGKGVARYGGDFAKQVHDKENNVSLKEWLAKGNKQPNK